MSQYSLNDVYKYALYLSKKLNIELPPKRDGLTLTLWISENDPSHQSEIDNEVE